MQLRAPSRSCWPPGLYRFTAQKGAAIERLPRLQPRLHLLSRNTSNRKIKYTLGKLKWQIRSPDYLDEVTIDFTGFRGQHEFIADYDAFSDEESSNGESRSDEDIIEEGDNGEVKEDEESTTKQQLQENTKSLESVHEKYTNLAEAAMNYSQLAMKAKSKK